MASPKPHPSTSILPPYAAANWTSSKRSSSSSGSIDSIDTTSPGDVDAVALRSATGDSALAGVATDGVDSCCHQRCVIECGGYWLTKSLHSLLPNCLAYRLVNGVRQRRLDGHVNWLGRGGTIDTVGSGRSEVRRDRRGRHRHWPQSAAENSPPNDVISR